MRKIAAHLLLPLLLATAAPFLNAEPLIQTGEAVAFMGDSITQHGAQNPSGYVQLVEKGLAANGIKITVLPAGVSGNKSGDMLARMGVHVINRQPKPTWVTISCGVNDVWHSAKGGGTPLETYKANVISMVDQAQAAGIKVMLLTATLIGPDATDHLNLMAMDYNNFIRDLARERNLPLADLNALMLQEQPSTPGGTGRPTALTTDGVHMNHRGGLMMARGVLRAFGLNDAQMTRAEQSWEPITVGAQVNLGLTIGEMEALQNMMDARKKNMNEVVYEIVSQRLAQERAATASAPAAP